MSARPLAERFSEKVDRRDPGECWLWLGLLNGSGYGVFSMNGRTVMAHRVAYERQNGSIPPGLEIDHLCRNRTCVNPVHLEPVTGRVNTLRSTSFTALNARKTHCPAGHAYDRTNTFGRRGCRTCVRSQQAAYRQTHKAAVRALNAAYHQANKTAINARHAACRAREKAEATA
jgi:HNH endonuclease